MKVKLTVDSGPALYEYSLGKEIEVPDDLWHRFKRAESEYDRLHAELYEFYQTKAVEELR